MRKHIIKTVCCCLLGLLTCSFLGCQSAKTDEYKEQSMVVKTESGLSYDILQASDKTEQPSVGDRVTVHYTGWLNKDGEPGAKFDSSVDRGEPFTFVIGVGRVISGWDEGVKSMKVGEKRRLFIPASLGYGARGAGASIPPHADLIFDVELLGVQK
jgi:FKBP-type peptidyl-prolyl cis-trans isomerase